MKHFFGKYGLWALFVAVVATITLCLVSFFSVNSSPLTNVVNTVLSPFRKMISSAHTWTEEKSAYFQEHESLAEENQELKLRVAELEAQVRRSERDSKENARLRTLLGLKQQHRDLVLESAKIVARSSSNWENALTLNHGTDVGIACDDCVITEAGQLVGIVKECGENWCKVLTVLDTETSLGALVFRTQEDCVVSGDFSQMTEGRLSAQYIDPHSEIRIGDLIVTSGLGGYYPSDLTVGTVESLRLDASGLAYTATLRPAADIDNLTQVFIIKDFSVIE